METGLAWRGWLGFGLTAALLASGPAVRAASTYDPELTWRTVLSPHFAVHYHEGGRNLALRVSRVAEEAIDGLGELFGFVPEGRIEIVLGDNSDLVNGFAQVMPKNMVTLFLTAPTEHTGLASYDDWLRLLVTHELAHICDIDQTWGLTRFLRWIFGKYIAMNGFTPQLLSEGVAVYAETVLTETGRGRSSYVDMVLRMAALEDRFVPIDRANILFSDWPGPASAYFFGGKFHLWLAERYGRRAVRDLHQFYAAMPVPYVYWPGAEYVLGDSLPDLWDAWHADVVHEAERARERVAAAGITPSRRITFHGRNITGSRFSPDGTFIIYSRTSPVDGATVRRVDRDGSDDRHLVLETYSPRFSFAPDGRSFYFSQNAINDRFNDYDDLYRYDLEEERAVKLRDEADPDGSLRARDPDVSADGERLVFVQNRLHQSWLSTATFAGQQREALRVRVLVGPRGDMQHASPRFSPDGRTVAVSTWFPGGFRDIVLYDAQSGELRRRITADQALDASPAWSPDGRYLLYESDATGIFNIYAYDMTGDAYFRVTNVVGGAFQPDVSPDGSVALFRSASGIGFDIHEIPFAPDRWQPLSYAPTDGYRPLAAPTRASMSQAPAEQTSEPSKEPLAEPSIAPAAESSTEPSLAAAPREADWWQPELGPAVPREQEPPIRLRAAESDEPYSPWRTLLPFQDNWVLMPAVYFYQEDPSVQLTTFGRDALGEHAYVLSGGGSLHGRRPNWSAVYFNDVWSPTFAFGGSDVAFARRLHDTGEELVERSRSASASVTLPIFRRHLADISYSYQRRTIDSNEGGQWSTERNTFAWLQLGYTYAHTRQYAFSVGQEHGQSIAVAGRVYNEALGSGFNELLVTLDGRAYVNNPLLDNHVLALRLVGTLAFGPDYEETFYLGGTRGTSFFTVEAARSYALRGYWPGAGEGVGTGLLAAYAEYRFPLWQVERGLWTVPTYLERFHMALFMEGGNTFGNGSEQGMGALRDKAWHRLRGAQVGAGAELRTTLVLGWAFPLTLRLGAATLVLHNGQPTPGPTPRVYLELGTAI